MTPIPLCSRSDHSGFTAIEVVIVILVLGTLSALAAPLLNSALVEARLGATTTEITAAIEYAQMTAMNTGRPCRVTVDANTETLRVEQRVYPDAALLLDPTQVEIEAATVDVEEAYSDLDNPNHPGNAYAVNLGRSVVEVSKSSMGVDQPLLFSEVGKPSTSADVVLVSGGRTWSITVDGLSGAVTHSE